MSDDFVPAASSDPVVTERRHTVLTQLAKSEDISDFVGERTDEAALFDRGEPISNERAARALNEANSGVQQQVQPDATPLTEEDLESHFRTRALSQLAKSEDIEDYLAERQAQERYFEEGETLSDDEQDAWFKRARSALQDTHAELTGEPPPDEATQREREYQDFAEYGRREGAAAERVKLFLANNAADPEARKQEIIQWHQNIDPNSTVADWLIDNQSPVPGDLASRP